MNLAGRPPVPKAGKPVKDADYLDLVRAMPCCACGRHAPSEAHHCRDMPDYDERGLYDSLPGAALKSSDRDTIPLCPTCHWTFHNRRLEFHRLYGKDYHKINSIRRASGMITPDGG